MTLWICVASSRVGDKTSAKDRSVSVLAHQSGQYTLCLANSSLEDLKNTDREGCRLASSRLRLSDSIATLAYLDDSSRLYG